MTTSQYLGQINRINIGINNKLAEIYQLKSLVYNISIANEGEKVKTSKSQDKLGDAISKIVDMECEIDTMIDDLIEKKRVIIGQIEKIEDINQYNVLFLFYIQNLSVKDIAKRTNYSRQQVWRIHNEALKAFENEFGSEIF